MTPNMSKALSDALAAEQQGGLHYTVAGWQRPGAASCEYHSFVTISALEREGYLVARQKRTRMSITTEGQQALILARNAVKGTKTNPQQRSKA